LCELERAHEQDNQQWAKHIQELLRAILVDVKQQGGSLPVKQATGYIERYRDLLRQAEIECPPPEEKKPPNSAGESNATKPGICSNAFSSTNRMFYDS